MSTAAQEIYTETVRALPPADRLRLAALILEDLTRPGAPPAVIDADDAWTQEDQRDLTSFSLGYAATLYPEDEDLVR